MLQSRRKILGFLIALLLVMAGVGGVTREVLADDVDVVIWFSEETVSKGDSVSAVVSVSGDAISSFTMDVSYTSSVLEFTGASGMANGGGGNVRISFTGPGSVTLNFTAIANGTASVSTSGNECYDINLNQLSVSHAGASMTVSTPEATTEKKTEKNSEEDPNNNTTEEKDDGRSKNCYLAALSVSPGNLSPSFSKDNTAYSVQVDKDVTSLVVSATPEDDKSETYVSGADSLSPGLNSVRVTVTAENGAVKVYTITVQCGDEKDPYQVMIDGISWTIERSLDIEAPEGFTDGKVTFKGEEIDCLVSPNGKISILPLSNGEDVAWFIYDAKDTKFTPYVEYSAAFARFLILELPDNVKAPEGYQPTEITIGNNKVKAFTDGSKDGFYLVYAVNIDNKKETDAGFYLYDSVEDTYMRFPGVKEQSEEATTEQATTESVATQNEAPTEEPDVPIIKEKDEGFLTKNMLKLIAGVLAGLLVLLAIILIVMIVKNAKLRNRLDEHGPFDDDEDADDDEPMEEERTVALPQNREEENVSPEQNVPLSEEEKTAIASESLQSEVTGDTGEILLETAEDNNSSVQVERVEDIQDRIKEAMKDRPYGIDSAFDVVAGDDSLPVEPSDEEDGESLTEAVRKTADAWKDEMTDAAEESETAIPAATDEAIESAQETVSEAEAAEASASENVQVSSAENVQAEAAEEQTVVIEKTAAAEKTAEELIKRNAEHKSLVLPGDMDEE